ncbi:MAG: YciI family protein [Polyangiaceae bacterium]
MDTPAMPDFMVMILADESRDAQLPPAEMKALVEGHSAYEAELRAASTFLDAERLRPSGEGRRVSFRDGKARVEIGPFAGGPLAGYYLLQAESLDAAAKLAERCPMAPGAALDVRPIMSGKLRPGKSDAQGRIFAFAVLGNAESEQGWIDVMDRIEASSSRNNFPEDRMLGGVRLEAPSRGRRVVTSGNQRAIFDGPFLESKEVIGGLFFIRMSNIEEAVTWASESAFVKIGAVEIRELWRS